MKRVMFTLFALLSAFVVAQRERIAYETRHWQPWWKIAGVLGLAFFATLALMFSMGVFDDYILSRWGK